MEKRLPRGIPPFTLIVENEFIHFTSTVGRDSENGAIRNIPNYAKSPFLEDFFPCDCHFGEDVIDPELQACGEHSSCINRSLSVECNAEDCPCRDRCQNQRFTNHPSIPSYRALFRFQKHQFSEIEVFETPGKGFGLRTLQDLSSNQFVVEYVGEVVDQDGFEMRAEAYGNQGQKHFYFMTLQNDHVIDATRKGNLSRFMNHSCNPNCATQKWIVNGQLRIGLFTKRKIRAGSELTFDYKFIRFGATAQKCLCGEPNCKGVIGEEQKGVSRPPTSKSTQQEEEDAKAILQLFASGAGIEQQEDIALICRLLLRLEDMKEIIPLFEALLRTEESLLKRFVSHHGLQILNIIIGLHWRDLDFLDLAVRLLGKLPISNKNPIDDSHIEEKLKRLRQREDISEDLRERLMELLNDWSHLERPFRIPKLTIPLDMAEIPPRNLHLLEKEASAVHDLSKTNTSSGYSLTGDIRHRSHSSKWNMISSPHNTGPNYIRSESNTGQYEHHTIKADNEMRLQAGWRKTKTKDGQAYYYNEVTKESRWEMPLEGGTEKGPNQHPVSYNREIPGANRRFHNDYRRGGNDDGQPYEKKRHMEYTDRSYNEDRAKINQRKPVHGDSDRAGPYSNRDYGRDVPAALASEDPDKKLKEIIDRAKKAALLQSPGSSFANPQTERLLDGSSSNSSSSSTSISEEWKIYERVLRNRVSGFVTSFLKGSCKSQMTNDTSLRDLSRKLTFGIVDKEMRTLRKDPVFAPTAQLEELTKIRSLPDSKAFKITKFLSQYLISHGYRMESGNAYGGVRVTGSAGEDDQTSSAASSHNSTPSPTPNSKSES